MRKLYILTDNYFLKKDFIRFEIEALNKFFDLKIISLKKKIKKNDNIKIIHIKKFSDLSKTFSQNKKIYLIDLMGGIDLISWKIRNYLSSHNVVFIKMVLGTIPFPPKKNILLRIFFNFIPGKTSGGGLIRKIFNNLLIYFNRNFRHDYAFVAGKVATQIAFQKKIQNIVKFKSFDTLNFEKTKIKKNKKNPIVFIDNDIFHHPDFKYHGTTPPLVDKKKYYESLSNFFHFLEQKFKTKVVIALNPKSNLIKAKKNFLNRSIFQNKTAHLIRNSKFSIIHHSTALSYCVLSKKPVIFITNNDLKKSWLQREIVFSASQLRNKVLNIDTLNKDININNYLIINRKYYKIYVNNYLYEKKIDKNVSFAKALRLNLNK